MSDYLPPLALTRLPYSYPREEKGRGRKKQNSWMLVKVRCPKSGGVTFKYDCDSGFCKCKTEECKNAEVCVEGKIEPELSVDPGEEYLAKLRLDDARRRSERTPETIRLEEQVESWNWGSDKDREDTDDVPF